MNSSSSGMTLQEVMIGVIILGLLSPVVYQTYTFAVKTEQRRAIQEECVGFASDYLEQCKLDLLRSSQTAPFDTVRLFRGDTLTLTRSQEAYEEEKLLKENIAVVFKNDTLVQLTHLIPKTSGENGW